MATPKKRKERTQKVPAGESPEQRFTRLCNTRVVAVSKRLRLLRNLAGPSYKFTPEQYEKFSSFLESEMQFTFKAFAARISAGSLEKKEDIFSL